MRKTVLVAGVLAATLVSASAANAASELIANGGFVIPGVVDPSFTFAPVGGSVLPGWDVLNGYVDVVRGVWASSDGDGYSIDLIGGNGVGGVAQTIATTAGQRYTLTFDLSANPDDRSDLLRTAKVRVGGVEISEEQYALTPANSRANMLWSTRTLSFVATDDSTEIAFFGAVGAGNCCWGAALDNVSVTAAVPEPATWALMIVGFGGVGAMIRRRTLPASI